MSSEDHMNESRKNINSLIDLSENSKHNDVNNFKNNVSDSWIESVTPWKAIISHPRYFPYQVSFVIKRKSKVDSRVPDWQRTSLLDGDTKQTVRCVNDELEGGPYLHWKGMVEQVTYRYVPHNGYYRTMKFLSFDKRDWFTVNKKQPEQVSMSWQSKRYQKELRRQLKRDFESQNRKDVAKLPEVEVTNDLAAVEIPEIKESTIDLRRNRAKSTKSSTVSPRVQTDQDGNFVPGFKSAPLPVDFYKSRSDLYIENISIRISALEHEIAKDTKIRKNQDETIKPLFRSKMKDKGKDKDVTPRPYKKESLPEDVFTAKSVGNTVKEGKPTDKLTPVSRMSTADSKSSPITHLKYTTNSGNDSSNVNLPTMDLEKTLNSYKMAIETTRQSLLSTLNGKQISRRTITSKTYNAPTSITICDSGDSDKETLQKFIRPLKGEKRVRDKNHPVNGVATLLPEIAGKRLEVSTTSHRWL